MIKILKISGKVLVIALACVLALAILVVGGLNIAKFAIYSEYYSMKTDLCTNPGLNDGFVCQGICASENDKMILVSGYMTDKSASRIYITDLESNSYFVTLEREDKPFSGHAGGIALSGDTVYLSYGKKLYSFSLIELLAAPKGGSVEIGSGTPVNTNASFVYADESYVYVGEFHDGGKYLASHPYDTAEGMHNAVISRYSHADLEHPDKIYSVRDKVQGVCFTPGGNVVLSTSYGLSDTVYYIYNEADATDSGLTLDGAPVYYLENSINEIKGPAMGEDMDYYDGRVITLTESASNKYIFGKLFFANKIFGLDIE